MQTDHASNNFNLLRIVFALMVVLAHSPELIDGNPFREPLVRLCDGGMLTFGGLGVGGFFLLSGYLIVGSWERTPALLHFMRRRVLRIYPGFIVASLFAAFVVPMLVVDYAAYLGSVEPVRYLASVILLRPPVTPPVFTGFYSDLNGAMWTISYEFRCYVITALLGVLGLVRQRYVWLGVTILLAAVSLRVEIADSSAPEWLLNGIGSLHPFFKFASLFFVGGCFYLFRPEIPLKGTIALAAAVVLVLLLRTAKAPQLAMLTAFAYLLFWFAFKRVALLDRLKTLPDISYGLYLYAWPVQLLLIHHIPGVSPWTVFAIATVISAVLGYLSWHGVEKWFLRLKAGGTTPPAPSLLPSPADVFPHGLRSSIS